MPAESEKQRKLFGTALGQQRSGEITDTPAGKIAETVPEEKIREFARKPKKKMKKSFPGPAVNPLDEPEDNRDAGTRMMDELDSEPMVQSRNKAQAAVGKINEQLASKLKKAKCPNCYGETGGASKCPSCGSRTDKPMSRYGREFNKPLSAPVKKCPVAARPVQQGMPILSEEEVAAGGVDYGPLSPPDPAVHATIVRQAVSNINSFVSKQEKTFSLPPQVVTYKRPKGAVVSAKPKNMEGGMKKSIKEGKIAPAGEVTDKTWELKTKNVYPEKEIGKNEFSKGYAGGSVNMSKRIEKGGNKTGQKTKTRLTISTVNPKPKKLTMQDPNTAKPNKQPIVMLKKALQIMIPALEAEMKKDMAQKGLLDGTPMGSSGLMGKCSTAKPVKKDVLGAGAGAGLGAVLSGGNPIGAMIGGAAGEMLLSEDKAKTPKAVDIKKKKKMKASTAQMLQDMKAPVKKGTAKGPSTPKGGEYYPGKYFKGWGSPETGSVKAPVKKALNETNTSVEQMNRKHSSATNAKRAEINRGTLQGPKVPKHAGIASIKKDTSMEIPTPQEAQAGDLKNWANEYEVTQPKAAAKLPLGTPKTGAKLAAQQAPVASTAKGWKQTAGMLGGAALGAGLGPVGAAAGALGGKKLGEHFEKPKGVRTTTRTTTAPAPRAPKAPTSTAPETPSTSPAGQAMGGGVREKVMSGVGGKPGLLRQTIGKKPAAPKPAVETPKEAKYSFEDVQKPAKFDVEEVQEPKGDTHPTSGMFRDSMEAKSMKKSYLKGEDTLTSTQKKTVRENERYHEEITDTLTKKEQGMQVSELDAAKALDLTKSHAKASLGVEKAIFHLKGYEPINDDVVKSYFHGQIPEIMKSPDGRPPKEWLDKAIRKARTFSDDAIKYSFDVWYDTNDLNKAVAEPIDSKLIKKKGENEQISDGTRLDATDITGPDKSEKTVTM